MLGCHAYTSLTTDSSVMRLEFTTEIARNEFFQHMRNTKNVWLIHGKEYGKAKVENDIPTSDRLAPQPNYTLLDLFQGILPADMKGSNGELQSDRATLQVWPDKNSSTYSTAASAGTKVPYTYRTTGSQDIMYASCSLWRTTLKRSRFHSPNATNFGAYSSTLKIRC